jgi:flagellar biosynthetic protein FlhB
MEEERDRSDKTEDPTLKRLEEAFERGDVVKSQEVNTWFVLAGATLVLAVFSGSLASGLGATLKGIVANAHDIPADPSALSRLVRTIGADLAAAAAIPFALLMLAAVAGNAIQHRLVWSAEPLKPKLSKISPAAGAKRLFSQIALMNFAKGVAKVALIGSVMLWLMWPEHRRLDALVATDLSAVVALTKTLALQLLGAVIAVLAVVAALDYLFQYRQWFERQKMSVRELKEEFKQTEGDPAIKGKIRQLRQTRMRQRMMAAVPGASVVITNPTHYAVALKYERGMNAPVCVAKGLDRIALKIKEVAAAHNVPIVENPPLARTLHAAVEIDQEIAPAHYKAVAEVIGYVMGLRRTVWREARATGTR